VAAVSAGEISRALAWQGVRLEFAGLPLAEVVKEFNLRNRQQLLIGDAATGRLRVGGSFRADNVEAFVRLLEASFGVTTARLADGSLVLRRAK
jgi:transmembrane sensor